MHTIQNIPIPLENNENPVTHYFRITPPNNGGGDIFAETQYGLLLNGQDLIGSRLSFDTLYGALSLWTWSGTCGVQSVAFQANIVGDGIIRFWIRDHNSRLLMLAEESFKGIGQELRWSLSNLPKHGILYPEFIIKSDLFHVHNCAYLTEHPKKRNARVALVMTTFKRERFVQKNIQEIVRGCSSQLGKELEVLVIDNGQTLPTATTHPDIRIIPNQNFGGSGGFTRGVIEAFQSDLEYTHLLFCDDDVEIEPEAISRAVKIASYLEHNDILGGGMMSLTTRDLLYELGGTRNLVDVIPGKRGLPMSQPDSVACYDAPMRCEYFGWWFCLLPKTAFLEHGLPLPLFVRCDDEEFGRRLNKAGYRRVSLLGCVVHHEDFLNKDTPLTWCYVSRNLMIMAILHGDRENVLSTIACLALHLQLLIITKKPLHAEGILLGLRESLRGPEELVRMGSDLKHKELGSSLQSISSPIENINPDFAAHQIGKITNDFIETENRLTERYREYAKLFHTIEFWQEYLGLPTQKTTS